MWEEAELEAGEYLCYIEINWQQDNINDFVLSTYGSSDVAIIRDEKNEHTTFLE